MVGVPCGTMDQMTSMNGQAEHALFLDCRTLDCKQVPLPLESMGLSLLIIDTRAPHRLVSGEYASRRRDCEAAAAALGVAALRDANLAQVEQAATLSAVQRSRARHVVTENQRVLDAVQALERGDLASAGPLITASHTSLRDDFEVTVPELDLAAATAVDAGALGARMIGGGFGGCVLALVRKNDAASTFEAVSDAFARRGLAGPIGMLAHPSAGARRLA
jgi:galactokinase